MKISLKILLVLLPLCSHHINLIPGSKPVSSPPYRLHPDKAVVVKKEIGELLLDMGIIKQSDSSWASPIVLVPKFDSSVRSCTEYREVSKLTLPDPFPLHRVKDLMDRFGRSKYLTKIDMTRGYYQFPLNEYSGLISAFVTPSSHFE